MSCCGRSAPHPASAPTSSTGVAPSGPAAPTFEYTGATALSVRGPVSGLAYRFEHAGARLKVDPRDRASLRRVPVLRDLG